jgi:hypothetical protein
MSFVTWVNPCQSIVDALWPTSGPSFETGHWHSVWMFRHQRLFLGLYAFCRGLLFFKLLYMQAIFPINLVVPVVVGGCHNHCKAYGPICRVAATCTSGLYRLAVAAYVRPALATVLLAFHGVVGAACHTVTGGPY